MPIKFVCKDYGFDCDFVTMSKDVAGAIEEYRKHSNHEHGIEYSKEILMQFIMRKG
jgi:predicted small metal-binding protein